MVLLFRSEIWNMLEYYLRNKYCDENFKKKKKKKKESTLMRQRSFSYCSIFFYFSLAFVFYQTISI
jgi:hypothetical protein